MEVDEEVENKKKLDEQRRRLQQQIREIEKFTDVDQMFRDSQKEKWKERLEKRTLARTPEDAERSQKMQSVQGKKRNLLKKVGACDEGMGKVREEINEREARYLELAEKSNNKGMAAEHLEEEFRCLQAGEERRGSCASQCNGCCLDAVVEQLFTLGATHARQQIQALQEELIRRFEIPATPAHMAGGEERGGEWEEEQVERAASRQMGPPAPGKRNEGFPVGSVFSSCSVPGCTW